MAKDQFIIKKQLLKKNLSNDKLTQLNTQIQKSKAFLEKRQQNLPKITLNSNLPIYKKQDEIIQLLAKHQVIIVCGATGSGKTTQLPQICLQAGFGLKGKIAHTQPRRLAARTVANRIAEELKQELGNAVGYKIRFQDKTNNCSYIKLMTDGILLNEIHHDPLLLQYDTIIIDEAHERSLNIDFLLGYLKKLSNKRPDVKIIITSATIDPLSFSHYFNRAPIVNIEGRSYPVDILYRDYFATHNDIDATNNTLLDQVALAIEECFAIGDGDILIFYPTEKDIHEAKKHLKKVYQHDGRIEVLPLFSRLTQAEQNLIFYPKNKKRIILATNVAETSVTVPRIDFVIDTGLARVSRYNVRSKIQRLPIEKISQASANQRSGRCGRLRPGTAIRLYSQQDFDGRSEFTQAEILRTNLASVILQMTALNLGKIEQFPFINPPEAIQINDGYRLLFEIGAFNKQRQISKTGRQLAKYPLDPQCAKMLISASQTGCLKEMITIVSAISVADPKERPHDKKQQADTAHQLFRHKQSDFLSYLNLFNEANTHKTQLTQNKFRKWCKKHFISYQRFREWLDIHKQISDICQQQKLSINSKAASYETLHQAILSGLATHIAIKDEKFTFIGTRNRKMKIFPASSLFKKPPKAIVALEIAETSEVFAKTVAKIELNWVEPWVQHLISKTYSQPTWKKKPGVVSAKQTSNLYGLDISNNKKVNYCNIDPSVSRTIFIRHALVYGQWQTRAKFLLHNQALYKALQENEHKARRQDILVNDEWLENFYQQHIPKNICTGATFEKWAKQNTQPQLFLSEKQLIQNQLDDSFDKQYPSTLMFDDIELTLKYQFHPGEQQDGATLQLPLELLHHIPSQQCEWLVPGLIEDKCISILKGLPKAIRKQLVPIPSFVKGFLASTPCHTNSLFLALKNYIDQQKQLNININELKNSPIEDYYLMGFQIINEDSSKGAYSKNLDQLKTQYQQKKQAKQTNKTLNTQNIEKWDFGDLQESVTIKKQNYKIKAYPALTVENKQLQIHTFTTEEEAQKNHINGLIELIKRYLKKPISYAYRNLVNIDNTCLQLNTIQNSNSLKDDIVNNALYQHFFSSETQMIRQQKQFLALLNKHKDSFQLFLNQFCTELNQTLNLRQQVIAPLKKTIQLGWIESFNDIKDQDNYLIYNGFIRQLSLAQLKNYQRYYQAIKIRIESVKNNPEKDRMLRVQCLPLWEQVKQLLNLKQTTSPQQKCINDLRWKMEELRISLFAQQIKTKEKISIKRVEKLLNEFKQL